MDNTCKHQWHVLAGECGLCGIAFEDYIKELEEQLAYERMSPTERTAYLKTLEDE